MKIHTTGILLTYYEPYAKNAIIQFEKLLRSLPGTYSIVIVNNGPVNTKLFRSDLDVICGKNSLREFSGWEIGLEYMRKKGIIAESSLVVFANDTFCHHNKFGPITRLAFQIALCRLINSSTPSATGEIQTLGKPFSINGLISDRWIATYLFGMNKTLIRHISKLTPDTPISNFYQNRSDDELEFSPRISSNLARHIERYLIGSNETRWPGATVTGAKTLLELQGKANSIICEFYLSAYVQSVNGTLINVFASPIWRQIRRIEALPRKWASLVGKPVKDIYSR